MGARFLRRETAKKCPIHAAVLQKARDDLAEKGYFSKADIIERLQFGAIDDSIRWDYIADFIREEDGTELIPMAERFFKRSNPVHRATSPEKFMAMGHGKKTAGYALLTVDNGVYALKTLKVKRGMSNGVGKAFLEFAEACHKRAALTDEQIAKVTGLKLEDKTQEAA
jgi:hypothetical protein